MRRRPRRKKCSWHIFLFCFFMLCITLFFILFETRMRPVMNQVAEARAQSVAVSIINDEVNQTITSESIEYGALVNLQKDEHMRVAAVTANIVEMNRLKAELGANIQKRLRTVEEMQAWIPLGTLISGGLFIGYGPRIKLQLTPVGYADVNIADSFTQAGINQTRHEIHLTVKATVRVLLPITSISTTVTTDIPVAQSVIIGEVPDSFTEVEGVNGEAQDNILNLLN